METATVETARRRRGYWFLIGTLVVLGGATLLFTLAGFALVQREGARRERCGANLARLYLAVAQYADANGTYPPAFTVDENGRALHSWRVLLLPFLEEGDLFAQIRLDEPWNSDWNSQFHDKTPNVFQCASTPDKLATKTERCAVSAVLGAATPFPVDGSSVAPAQILDGASNTILFVERKSPVCWLNPDVELTEETVLSENAKPSQERVDFGSWHGRGETVVFGDGRTQFLSDKIDENVLKLLLEIDNSEPEEMKNAEKNDDASAITEPTPETATKTAPESNETDADR